VLLLVGIALSNSWQLVLSHESDEDADPMGWRGVVDPPHTRAGFGI